MPVPVLRAAAVKAPPINFLSPDFYSGMGAIKEGNYCLFFDIMMHRFMKKDGTPGRGPESLKVRVSAYDLANPTAEPQEGFYNLGKTAHLSYQPNPETGKSLVAVPGGPGGTLPKGTNWDILLESMWASGLPRTVVSNDFSVIDGMWVHIVQVDEPESRKDIGKGKTKTGAAAIEGQGDQEEEYKPGKIAVVSEILEGGMPWEGGGGLPEAPVAVAPTPRRVTPPVRPAAAAMTPAGVPVAPARVAPPVRPAPRVAAPPPPPPPPANGEVTEEDLGTAATTALADYFEKNPNGGTGVLLKTQVFKHVGAAYGDDMAQMVQDTYFADDATLNSVIEQLGYTKVGAQIKRKA